MDTIVVTIAGWGDNGSAAYVAQLVHRDGMVACRGRNGKSPEEAIGKLILEYPQEFNVGRVSFE